MTEVAEKMDYQGQTFDVMDFDDLSIPSEKSKYPFDEDWLVPGKAFLVRKPQASVSGRVSSQNKKSDKIFKTRQTTDPSHGESSKGARDGASKENPFTWVVRVK